MQDGSEQTGESSPRLVLEKVAKAASLTWPWPVFFCLEYIGQPFSNCCQSSTFFVPFFWVQFAPPTSFPTLGPDSRVLTSGSELVHFSSSTLCVSLLQLELNSCCVQWLLLIACLVYWTTPDCKCFPSCQPAWYYRSEILPMIPACAMSLTRAFGKQMEKILIFRFAWKKRFMLCVDTYSMLTVAT